jgi:hypothetical protein
MNPDVALLILATLAAPQSRVRHKYGLCNGPPPRSALPDVPGPDKRNSPHAPCHPLLQRASCNGLVVAVVCLSLEGGLKIFVSYRREDSSDVAGRIADHLRAEFGDDSIFIDVDTLVPGADFDEILARDLARCDMMIALIGPTWVDVRDRDGSSRLTNPQDFVRMEIRDALRRDIPVIPILVKGAKVPRSDLLPDDIAPLTTRNAFEVRHTSFHPDLDGLVHILRWVAREGPKAPFAHASSPGLITGGLEILGLILLAGIVCLAAVLTNLKSAEVAVVLAIAIALTIAAVMLWKEADKRLLKRLRAITYGAFSKEGQSEKAGMTKVGDLKAKLNREWPAGHRLELSLRIIDYLTDIPNDQLEMLTFSSIMKVAGADDVDADLVGAVSLLSNNSIHALETRLLFIDDDNRRLKIDKKELAEARRKGIFIHPESGEPVEDFESKIIPYFVPTADFLRLKAG